MQFQEKTTKTGIFIAIAQTLSLNKTAWGQGITIPFLLSHFTYFSLWFFLYLHNTPYNHNLTTSIPLYRAVGWYLIASWGSHYMKRGALKYGLPQCVSLSHRLQPADCITASLYNNLVALVLLDSICCHLPSLRTTTKTLAPPFCHYVISLCQLKLQQTFSSCPVLSTEWHGVKKCITS